MSEVRIEGATDGVDHLHPKKEKKERKDKDKEKKKEKRKSKSGSRIERLSRVVKEKVHGHSNDSTDDEAKVDTEEEESPGEEVVFDGDEAGEHETGADGSSATKRLTLAQVKDRTLSAQSKRKRSATDGANASSLLGSFRRPGGSRLKKAEHAGSHSLAADDEDAAPHSSSGDGVGDEQQSAEDDAARSSSKKKDKKKEHSSRRKRKDEKTLPLMSSRQRASLGLKINGEEVDDSGSSEGGGGDQHQQQQHHKEGSDKRKHLTRSGSMMELNKQANQIERQTLTARTVSRDSAVVPPAKDTPTLERFVSLKNISMNLSSVFGDGGRGSTSGGGDKSPRRVTSTPEGLMQSASARKMNPLWVLNQKAKQVEEEKDKREREERRKREREVLPVGDDVPEKQRQRNRVINEIINTERDYVSDLRTMLTVFRTPLDEESILTKEELGAIFSNLSMLLHINTELYDDIAKTVKETNGEELGRCFVLLVDYLKMYSQYCSNQAAAREAVANATKTNPRFRAFMERMAMNPELNGLTLRDYLIKPVQRLCKYPLLMRELIKHTEETHADYPNLQEAFGKIEAVVTSVNEKKQADEDREVIARIISRLSNTEKFGVQLMVPGRRLVQDGKVSELAKDETVRRQFFLFTDLLILAEDLKPGSSRRKEPATWKVVSMILFAEASVLDLPDKSDQHHRIDIACKKDVTTLCFDTPEEKQEWLTSLTGKMQKLQSLSARSASSSQFDELGSASLNGVGTAAAGDRFRSPSPPSGPATFPATSLSP